MLARVIFMLFLWYVFICWFPWIVLTLLHFSGQASHILCLLLGSRQDQTCSIPCVCIHSSFLAIFLVWPLFNSFDYSIPSIVSFWTVLVDGGTFIKVQIPLEAAFYQALPGQLTIFSCLVSPGSQLDADYNYCGWSCLPAIFLKGQKKKVFCRGWGVVDVFGKA